MGLLEEARAESRRRTVCSVTLLVERLAGEDRADLLAALDEEGVTGEAIAAALRRRGHQIAGQTVARHRAGRCSCGPAS